MCEKQIETPAVKDQLYGKIIFKVLGLTYDELLCPQIWTNNTDLFKILWISQLSHAFYKELISSELIVMATTYLHFNCLKWQPRSKVRFSNNKSTSCTFIVGLTKLRDINSSKMHWNYRYCYRGPGYQGCMNSQNPPCPWSVYRNHPPSETYKHF